MVAPGPHAGCNPTSSPCSSGSAPSTETRRYPGTVLPVVVSDLVLSPSQWSTHIVGRISEWIDLDSEDEKLRLDSELKLKQEIAWASISPCSYLKRMMTLRSSLVLEIDNLLCTARVSWLTSGLWRLWIHTKTRFYEPIIGNIF